MSKQRVRLHLPIDETWDAGDRIEVYTDFGSGSLDMTAPLLSRAVDLFPGQETASGYGQDAYGGGTYAGGGARLSLDGYGHTVCGETAYCDSPHVIDVLVDVPAAFGTWKFGVRAVDADGNVQAGGVQDISVVVSGTEPDPPTAFAFDSYDSETDQVICSLGD